MKKKLKSCKYDIKSKIYKSAIVRIYHLGRIQANSLYILHGTVLSNYKLYFTATGLLSPVDVFVC